MAHIHVVVNIKNAVTHGGICDICSVQNQNIKVFSEKRRAVKVCDSQILYRKAVIIEGGVLSTVQMRCLTVGLDILQVHRIYASGGYGK